MGIEKGWLGRVDHPEVKAMYRNAKSAVNINGTIGAFYHSTRSTFKGIQNRASLGVTTCRRPCADG